MQSETKNCQNCKNDFTIEPEDFSFYEKIKVPPPTFCPECRLQRRMSFMNIYSLYKRKCNLCEENIISMFSVKKSYNVYCSKCWWGDSWDGTEYAMEYNPERNFFDQLKELMLKTPFMSLDNQSTTLKKSQYVNYASQLKNCYLLYFADYAENSCYSSFLNGLKDSSDCYRIRESELCYGSIGIYKCFRAVFSQECDNCVDIFFSKNCSGCTNCFGCMNQKGKSYCIFNKQYTKEEYFDFLKNLNLKSYSETESYKAKAGAFWLTLPVRSYYGNSLNVNVTGDYVYESKNTKSAFMVTSAENCKYVQIISVPSIKDSYDNTGWGDGTSLIYEGVSIGVGGYNSHFCQGCYPNAMDNEYSLFSSACKNVFGCVNLKRKQYCILNKQYTKEEYEALREKIIADMQINPYKDKNGRLYSYGEFFPHELSLFGYNETIASDFFPIEKNQIDRSGYNFFEPEKNNYKSTIKAKDIKDELIYSSNILDEVIECDCGNCFKFIQMELDILNKLGLCLPRKCPECRRLERFNNVNLPKLFNRVCAKCGVDIKTSYAPDRPEIVYCEKCYQQEVY